jgi:hypothetical protein
MALMIITTPTKKSLERIYVMMDNGVLYTNSDERHCRNRLCCQIEVLKRC